MQVQNAAMQKASFDTIPPDAHGKISKRTAHLDGVDVTRVTFDVGARWSTDLKPHAGTDSCQLPHVALVQAGTLHVVMDDGTRLDINGGEAYEIAPGHDAWVDGDEPYEAVEFESLAEYAKG
jgi:hypothetical protein